MESRAEWQGKELQGQQKELSVVMNLKLGSFSSNLALVLTSLYLETTLGLEADSAV